MHAYGRSQVLLERVLTGHTQLAPELTDESRFVSYIDSIFSDTSLSPAFRVGWVAWQYGLRRGQSLPRLRFPPNWSEVRSRLGSAVNDAWKLLRAYAGNERAPFSAKLPPLAA